VRDDIDVAFRLTSRPPVDCIATPVLSFSVHAYAAPRATVLSGPQALAGQRCLVFGTPTDELTMTWVEERSGRSVAVDIQPTMTGDDLGTLQSVAAAGGGVVFAPDYCVRDQLSRKMLIDVLPGWTLPVNEGNTLLALTLPMATAPESARALVRYVRDALMPAASKGSARKPA
jgi:DNA-binding transcriptional LysR family regulator